ncbi:MAG: Prephenate dehydratase [Candidatus Methanofastidiosum methylothiophilum]|uniref:prephenate dehydratase n=1 Tax=Candidatus Methanofastidiosum methylothiophilum TaxID=1705564 RepID=A0A150J5H1_9EURY|nr:MAG: Prephenate dehydratase [Candidatus Methanofastidiosum methylthiophilus]NMC77012.1 prephenate dehydratase [Candidatus Methanofastidiosa archaeon]
MKVSTLGPKGTFCHEASLLFGAEEIVFKRSIWEVFNAIETHESEGGVVPVENSLVGGVSQTLDSLIEFDIKITKEYLLPIHHNLACWGDLEDIEVLYSHVLTLSQCEKFVRNHLPKVQIHETASNAISAIELSNRKDKRYAALVSEFAAELYDLKIIKKDVQDEKLNFTRFFVVGNQSTLPTGKDRTSIVVSPSVNRPGVLYSIIKPFYDAGIDLTKIESRPSKKKMGEYIFFIDFKGHTKDKKISQTLNELSSIFTVKVLGSYPRAY